MIRKLRRKFVLITMSLIFAVLLIVFVVILMTSYQQQREASYDSMRMALEQDWGIQPERFQIGKDRPRVKLGGLLPVFSVTLNQANEIESIHSGNVEVENELVQQAVAAALEAGKKEGTITSLNLRYLLDERPQGIRIAFLDRGVEQSAVGRLALTLLLVGLGGLLAFFAISLFLSNWALRPVERTWAQQQQFIADASHELKTPLTVILANLSILRQYPEETVKSQDKWIVNTREEAERMQKLVEELLFLARSDAEQAPLERAVFSLSDAVWSSILSFEPVAYEQGLTLSSEITLEIRMLGEERQIKQLMAILLDNAVKYAGSKGAISVRLEAMQDKARLQVTNTGAAIDEEELTRIFERFYRADKARSREKGGCGLGLSIAQEIVRRHGGTIAATSARETGTVFIVSLPL